MVTYLKDGQDFGPAHFSTKFGFQKSADMPRPRGGSVEDNNVPESVKTRVGTSFKAREPGLMEPDQHSAYDRMENDEIAREPKAKGGRVKRAQGGGVDDEASPRLPHKSSAPSKRWEDQDQWNVQSMPPEVRKMYNAPDEMGGYRKGGRVKRAIGGVIPGNAPAAGMQPMSAPPTPAPSPGNPLAKATVSMPASDLSNLATGAARVGALAQASRQHTGAQPVRMPGAVAISPAAQHPPMTKPGLGGVPGTTVQGMKKGGPIKRASGGLAKRDENRKWRDPLPGSTDDKMAMMASPPDETYYDEYGSYWTHPGSSPPDATSDSYKKGGRVRRADGGSADQSLGSSIFQKMSPLGKSIYGGALGPKKDDPPSQDQKPQGKAHGGRLTTKARDALPASDFALPGGRYPVDTPNRARNALARGAQNASPAELSRIKAKVHGKYPGIGKKG